MIDNYKRSLYMRALEKVGSRRALYITFICRALESVLVEEGFNCMETKDALYDLFPEFMKFYDHSCWFENGRHKYSIDSSLAWWEQYWIEPRVRALDCLLRDSR